MAESTRQINLDTIRDAAAHIYDVVLRTPLGEAIAHCTSDIEAIQTLFTSGVASLVITVTMVHLTLAPDSS